MCNRFHQSEKAVAAAREALGAAIDVDLDAPPPRQIFPTGKKTARHGRVFVRAVDGNRPLLEQAMEWGFPTQIRGASGKMLDRYVTNARNLSSSFWRPSLIHPEQRCLVPFSWFAEPDPAGGKGDDGLPAQVWFAVKDQPFGLFAGLWRDTERGPAFAFATTEPNAVVAPIHPKAMPAIVAIEDASAWLEAPADEAAVLVRPWAGELLVQRATPALDG
ncbi:DUF159 family protein [Sphingomonas ginsenosidimutans]|jgi:putative SOS response-associated peptidase YedK|uniref:DUF159 family protein n=1 Tax=Sphingomonas ginsenosidimutans TaxID=862134 RepID=A0A2A4HYE3_9SPHN|nr:SOS response-associated peptidase family protein [Sphingomonas ginsenosidimutans]PCG08705.1 DUF159 family protein [Sphingomonas ginsenosidimutans]